MLASAGPARPARSAVSPGDAFGQQWQGRPQMQALPHAGVRTHSRAHTTTRSARDVPGTRARACAFTRTHTLAMAERISSSA